MPVKNSLAAALICLTLPAGALAQSSGTTAGNGTPADWNPVPATGAKG